MDGTLAGAAGLLLAGAITPGPNNLVVLREAARADWRATAAAIVGIVSGALVLLLLTLLGIGVLLATAPGLATAVAIAGCLYLALLGSKLLVAQPTEAGDPDPRHLATGTWGLFLFQFLNPKAWLLVVTVSESFESRLGFPAALPPLVALFVLVPTTSLLLWSWAGAALRRLLDTRAARARLDRMMGLLLVVCAVLLFLGTWQ